MKNRKILSILSILLAAALLLCACGKNSQNKTDAEKQTDNANPTASDNSGDQTAPPQNTDDKNATKEQIFNEIKNSRDGMPYFYLKSNVASVKPGELFELEFYIANGENTASYDISLPYDSDVFEVIHKEDHAVGNMELMGNLEVGEILIAAYSMSVEDIEDDLVFSATVRVKDDAPAQTYEFLARAVNYQLCADDEGYNAIDITRFVSLPEASLTITITD